MDNPLLVILGIGVFSLAVSIILYKTSSALLKRSDLRLGGSIAIFVVVFWLLFYAYGEMLDKINESEYKRCQNELYGLKKIILTPFLFG